MSPIECKACRPGWQHIRSLVEDSPSRPALIRCYLDVFHQNGHDIDATAEHFRTVVEADQAEEREYHKRLMAAAEREADRVLASIRQQLAPGTAAAPPART